MIDDGLRIVGAMNVFVAMGLAASEKVELGIFTLLLAFLCFYSANIKNNK